MARKIFQCIQTAIEKDSIETIEYSLDARGGSLLFEMRLARLDDHSVISISRDITRRKKAEFALDAALTRAEEADALKSKFLANLSHDIRTPVNIIMGLTKLLAEPSLSEFEKGEFIHDVQQQGNSLLNIIENTIQLSKIETGTLEVHFSYTNIHQMLRELYLHFYPTLPDHRELKLVLHTEILHGEVGFETDPYLLKEALHRLIDNAIRFTVSGTVEFGYSTVFGNSAEFFVSDNGPGIPSAEKENIFLRFYVIESDRLSQKSGPGLGLPIAQHFVALLGGELRVDTEKGKGSRFWFRLPLRNAKGFLRVV
jgi:signal transduction histidine kinase